MTKVFVHGNPETADVWTPLVTSLAQHGVTDTVLLSPPGFGAPLPAGWQATPANYVAWLTEQLQAIGGTIDLIGHDWGAGHVFGFVAEQTGLIRSWAADCAGLLHPDYVWHDMAQVWQTEGAGEEAIAEMVAISLADRSEAYVGLGLPADVATAMAAGCNEDMGRCILELYRAAAQPALEELGQRVIAAAKSAGSPAGLVIDATGDPYVETELGVAVKDLLGAQHLVLEGQGHWWMGKDPDLAAAGLANFWKGLE
ncbi:MAG: alpha/beta fold hydrolase [Acidimicrobiales bacterium]